VISAGLKLDVYFGDSLASGDRMADQALMDCFADHELEVAALYRGIEGFGIGRRIHTERFPDVSTDLPLVAEAIDTREPLSVELLYSDQVGAQRTISRFALIPFETPEGDLNWIATINRHWYLDRAGPRSESQVAAAFEVIQREREAAEELARAEATAAEAAAAADETSGAEADANVPSEVVR